MSSQNNIFQRYYEQQDKNEELRPADSIKDQILSTYNLVARTVKLFDFFLGKLAHALVIKDQILSTYNLVARTVKLFDFFLGTLAHALVGTLKMFSDASCESPNDDGDLPNAMETKSSQNIK